MFKQLYAMEKIHGTSAHISFIYDELKGEYEVDYFSGGEKHDNFVKIFHTGRLKGMSLNLGFMKSFTVYGEAYGGKQQGMSETYGKELKFVAFEVKIGDNFVDVPFAYQVCTKLGIEFVHPNGGRIMAKHKNDIYKEREHAPKLQTKEQLKVLEDATAIAQEWVTLMRLVHVLDKLKAQSLKLEMKQMNKIILAMVEDVEREAKGEILENKYTRKAIGKKTVKLFTQYLKESIK